jgi:hypothetical protein
MRAYPGRSVAAWFRPCWADWNPSQKKRLNLIDNVVWWRPRVTAGQQIPSDFLSEEVISKMVNNEII